MHAAITPEVLNIIQEAAGTQAARQVALFGGLADLSRKDLVQHLITLALDELLPKYDPSRGASLKTYLNNCFYRRLIDLWRSKEADARRSYEIGRQKIFRDSGNNSDEIGNYFNVDGDCGLEDIGHRAMAAAHQLFPKYPKTGPHKFTQWQLLATSLVMQAREESTRGVLHLIRTSRSLRDALGYDGSLPTHQRLKQFIKRFEQMTGYRLQRRQRNIPQSSRDKAVTC